MPCSFRACSGRSATWLSTLAGTPRTSRGCCAIFVSFIRRGKSTPDARKPACAGEGNPRKPKPTGRCRGGMPRHFLGWRIPTERMAATTDPPKQTQKGAKALQDFCKDLLSLLDIRIYICIVVCYDHLMGIGI